MRTLSSPLFLLLAACSTPWEGLWYIEQPVLDASACGDDIEENYSDASVLEAGTDGDWTNTQVSALSGSAFFVEIIGGRDRDVFVVIGNTVYPGTSNRNMLLVSWTGEADDLWEEEHVEGYQYVEQFVSETEEVLTLIKDKETNGLYGTYEVQSTTTSSFDESDRWKPADTGFDIGQMPGWGYLTGDGIDNAAAEEDCSADDCHIQVTTTCDGKVDLVGRAAGKHDDGAFAAVEDATQEAGAGSASSGGTSGYPYY